MDHRTSILLWLSVILLLSGCGRAAGPPGSDREVLPQSPADASSPANPARTLPRPGLDGPELAAAHRSGAATVGDLFRIGFLTAVRPAGGPQVGSRRGLSWGVAQRPVIVLNGAPLKNVHPDWPDGFLIQEVRAIRVLAGGGSFLRYGGPGREGAILVYTLPKGRR